EIADIEDADAAEAVRAGRWRLTRSTTATGRSRGSVGSRRRRRGRRIAGRRRDTLGSAIEAAVHCLSGHKEKMSVDRDVALPAGAEDGRSKLDIAGTVDVVEVDAVIVADKEMIACKGKIGVRSAVLN